MDGSFGQHDVRVALRQLLHETFEFLFTIVERRFGLAGQRCHIDKNVVLLALAAGVDADKNALDAGGHALVLELPGNVLAQILSLKRLAAMRTFSEHGGTLPGKRMKWMLANSTFCRKLCASCL